MTPTAPLRPLQARAAHPPPDRVRRRGLLALAALLGGCAAPSAPTPWLLLRTDPGRPLGGAAAPAPGPAGTLTAWQLLPLRLAEYLERDALWLPQGSAQVLAGPRWAEPLRDAAARTLAHDLGLLLGAGRVWRAPLPAAALPALGQIGVELLALDLSADRHSLLLRARWWSQAPQGGPGRSDSLALPVAIGGSGIDALVAAHREALARLAESIAATLR